MSKSPSGMTASTRICRLTPGEDATLRRRATGEGGFQCLVIRLQGLLQADGSIELSDEDVEQIRRACEHDDGVGGFQGQLGKAFGRVLAGDLDRPGSLI